METSRKFQLLFAAILLLAVAAGNFAIFGLGHVRSWKDASEYSAYAANLANHGLYSESGSSFDISREPGYPAFLALIYEIFGTENFLAVGIVQTILLALLGFIIFYIFYRRGEFVIGILAGIAICGLPFYGLYTNELLTELLFTFLLGFLFLLTSRIMEHREDIPMTEYALFGLVAGYASLVRVQFILFLPFIAVCMWLFLRPLQTTELKKMTVSFVVFVALIGGWMLYVHAHNGSFAITQGRQERALNERAVRTGLSYKDLTRYAIAWIKRSTSGGVDDPFLDTYDFKGIDARYALVATSSDAIARIKDQNIRIIAHRPGQYLYGNLIELMKLLYIEHDFTDTTNRYLRAGLYVAIYTLFTLGVVQFLRRRGKFRDVAALSLLFIIYNCLTVTPFDVIPRYNTPYLIFFIVIGFTGVASLIARAQSAR